MSVNLCSCTHAGKAHPSVWRRGVLVAPCILCRCEQYHAKEDEDVALDEHGIDLYAVRLVVREGCLGIPLSHRERVLAAHLLRAKGAPETVIAQRLNVSTRVAQRYWVATPPIPVEDVDPHIIGNLPVGGRP